MTVNIFEQKTIAGALCKLNVDEKVIQPRIFNDKSTENE